jgi:hypothetical protein
MADDRPILIAYDGSRGAKAAIAEAGEVLGGGAALVVSVWQSAAAAAPTSVLAIPAGVARHAYEDLAREAAHQASALADEGVALAREAGFEATAATGALPRQRLEHAGRARRGRGRRRARHRLARPLGPQVGAARQRLARRGQPQHPARADGP